MVRPIDHRDFGVGIAKRLCGSKASKSAADDHDLRSLLQAIRSSNVRAVSVINSTNAMSSTLYDAAVPNASARN